MLRNENFNYSKKKFIHHHFRKSQNVITYVVKFSAHEQPDESKRFDLRKYLKQNIHNVIYTYGWKRTNIMPTKTGEMAIFTTGKNQFNTWRLASIKLLPETVKEGISLIYFLWKTKGCHKSSLLLLPITSQSLSVWHWKMFFFTHASTSDEIWEISKILNQRNFTLFILVANL